MLNMESWRELYPFQSRFHALQDGVRMHYVDEGEGDEAVLMLHGNPTWGFIFREFIKALSPRIRCVVPDHIGMGLSDKPQDYTYTLQRRAEDIGSFRRLGCGGSTSLSTTGVVRSGSAGRGDTRNW